MRKYGFLFLLLFAAFSVFAQSLSRVGILPFEASGTGVSAADAAEATRLVIGELSSWGTITVIEGPDAASAQYTVKGQITRQGNQIVLTATTYNSQGRALNTAKEQGATLGAVSMVSFCAKVAENVPYPNYLLGKWQSTINMPDGPVTCVMEFRSDRTVRVQQYDTWERSGNNALKYQAIGNGTYSYAGYLIPRTFTIRDAQGVSREVTVDATVGINLTLEDALPKYTAVSAGGLRVLFNDAKTSFELVNAGLPCGDNFSGPSVYPSAAVYYTRFTKIQ